MTIDSRINFNTLSFLWVKYFQNYNNFARTWYVLLRVGGFALPPSQLPECNCGIIAALLAGVVNFWLVANDSSIQTHDSWRFSYERPKVTIQWFRIHELVSAQPVKRIRIRSAIKDSIISLAYWIVSFIRVKSSDLSEIAMADSSGSRYYFNNVGTVRDLVYPNK